MRRQAVPRWLRTALVFFASLQAARAGSVEAQTLRGSPVERATASAAPSDPLLLRQQAVPAWMVAGRAGAAKPLAQDDAETAIQPGWADLVAGASHTEVTGAQKLSRPSAHLASPGTGDSASMLRAPWDWPARGGTWVAGRQAPPYTSRSPRGAIHARAPCPVPTCN